MPRDFLQVAHGLYPQANGGVEQYTWEVARNFGGAVLSLTPGAPADQEPWRGLRVLLRQPGESPRAAWERALDEVQPRLVLVQHLGAATPGLLLELAERDIPYVVFLHDFTALCPTHKLWHRRDELCSGPGRTGLKCAWCVSGTWRRGLELPLRVARYQHRPQAWRTALARAEWLVANSRFSLDFWLDQGAPPDRLGLIPPILIPPSPLPPPATGRPHRILYAGGWGGAKGSDIFMSALDLLQRPVEVEIVGPIPPAHVAAFQAAALPRHSLHFPGPLAPSAMAGLMAACNAVAVPSCWNETYGRLVTEAQWLGVPVAAAAVGGIPERIIHGLNGFLAAADDAASFAAALEDALEAPQSPLWDRDLARENAATDIEDAHLSLARLLEGRFQPETSPLDSALRLQWNHALAFFLACGCRLPTAFDLDPEVWAEMLSWFLRWGMAPAPSPEMADCVLAAEIHSTASLHHRFPAARAAIFLLPEEVQTLVLPT